MFLRQRKKITLKTLSSNPQGFTLIEMLVTMGIFVLVFGIVTGLIVDTIKMQNRARVMRMLQEEARYALEEITREGRLAQDTPPFEISTTGLQVTFHTRQGEVKLVKVEGDTFKISRDGINWENLTSSKVQILPDEGNIFQSGINTFGNSDNDLINNYRAYYYLTIRFKIQPNPTKVPAYCKDISAVFRTSIAARNYNF